ncbi:repetitive organellar protein-like isoform X2 [Leptopilina boulardi]|nr:repetitive organellar protein-like isoform X2 [Leptopilina boulardi]
MLERALTQPLQCSVDPLKNAQTWNIPIWAPEKLQAWLDKIYTSYKDTHIQHNNQSVSSKNLNVKQLKVPYIKFESYHRETKPVFLELQSWPTINFDGERGSCPFVFKKPRAKKEASESKETKENWEAANVNKEKGKEMTRRPRATTRARRAEQLVSGYCEICRSEYRDLTKHLQTDKHLSFVQNEDNFLSLDRLISTGASVEAFLKLNSSNDVRKDCKLFPNGDSSLHNKALSEQGDKSPKENLDNFSVDEIKMVQCNGARRNLNLKLNSPHNLRTRAKHESGHLLRSKGRSWIDDDKSNNDKTYDKFEGFTIKKRAKGTIWIEEDDPNEKSENESLKDNDECNPKVLLDHESDFKTTQLRKSNGHSESNNFIGRDTKRDISNQNNHLIDINNSKRKKDSSPRINDNHEANENESQNVKKEVNKNSIKDSSNVKNNSSSIKDSMNGEIGKEEKKNEIEITCNNDNNDYEGEEEEEEKECRGFKAQEEKDEKPRSIRFSRRGGRSYKGRQRLSVEERLIEDNRAYYKVEVLGSKLRSSVIPAALPPPVIVEKIVCEEEKNDEGPSSEKPVVVRFKRVRKSELSLLSDEAESFMFGETRRDDSSEASENEQSSVLPKDSESDRENTLNSVNLSSMENSSDLVKQEGGVCGDDSQDLSNVGRSKKKRRTQAEALIMDNVDYYKFETPGSRLRYQAPLTGIEIGKNEKDEIQCKEHDVTVDRLLPSKPSPEIERMQFSFEAIPKSEPWYQTYQRQDEGEEYWHYFSESNESKPFLLPYEIENFHETLMKRLQKMDGRRKSRGRGSFVGRSPRKSPRCHASTLAIMSTIIRKREQQQQHTPTLTVIDEENNAGKLETSSKQEIKSKSDVDEDLKEIAKNIDEMLSANDLQDDSNPFEEDFLSNVEETTVEETQLPKGAPVNLLELLENCHDLVPCLENSSCASSDCGDGNGESPLKRRKRRKNRTGWPGNKLRRKLHSKQLSAFEAEKKLESTELPALKEDICERLESSVIENEYPDNNHHIIKSSELCSYENNEEKRNRSIDSPDRRSQHSEELKDKEKLENQSSEDSKSAKSLKEKEFSDTEESLKSNNSETCEDSENTSNEKEISQQCDEELKESEKTLTDEDDDDDDDDNYNDEDDNESSSRGDCLNKKETLTEKEEINKRDSSSKKKDSSSDTVKNTTSDSSQLSENTAGNDENLKIGNKKRHHLSTSSSSDRESLAKRLMKNNVVVVSPRKRNMTKSIRRNRNCRRTPGGSSSETRVINFKTKCKARQRSTIRSNNSRSSGGIRTTTSSSSIILEDENCKQNNTFVNISSRTRLRRVRGGLSSENGDILDCPLSERVNSPVATPTDLQNRRSSIEFQPVVRVMKIEDQVDRDHSILSVAVASNRRLRSSGSSKSSSSSSQPPKKRFKSGRGHFSRWLKSS